MTFLICIYLFIYLFIYSCMFLNAQDLLLKYSGREHIVMLVLHATCPVVILPRARSDALLS